MSHRAHPACAGAAASPIARSRMALAWVLALILTVAPAARPLPSVLASETSAASEASSAPAVLFTSGGQGVHAPGATFTLDVALRGNTFGPVNSYAIRVCFHPDHVALTGAEDAGLGGNRPTWSLWGTESDGRQWRLIRTAGNVHNHQANLNLFRLFFTIADPAPEAIHIALAPDPDNENLLRNPDFGPIPHTLESSASDPLVLSPPPTPAPTPTPSPLPGEELGAWYHIVYRSGGRIVDLDRHPDRLIVDENGIFISEGAADDTLRVRLRREHRRTLYPPPIPHLHAPAGLRALACDGPIGMVMSEGAITRMTLRGAIGLVDVGQARDIRVAAPAPQAPTPAFVDIALAAPWANARRLPRPTTIRLAGIALGDLDGAAVDLALARSASKVFLDRATWPPTPIVSPGGLGDGRHRITARSIGHLGTVGGDIAAGQILLEGALGRMTASQIRLAGQTPGGAIGRVEGPPEGLILATGLGLAPLSPAALAADIGRVQASRSIHGVFYAGADRMGDGSVRPNHAGVLRRITVGRGGALAGEIHLSPEAMGRFPIFVRSRRFASNAMIPIYSSPVP